MTDTPDIDCMACIANLAGGIPHDEGCLASWLGMVHGTYWNMSTGISRILCMFTWVNNAWTVNTGPSKGWRIE